MAPWLEFSLCVKLCNKLEWFWTTVTHGNRETVRASDFPNNRERIFRNHFIRVIITMKFIEGEERTAVIHSTTPIEERNVRKQIWRDSCHLIPSSPHDWTPWCHQPWDHLLKIIIKYQWLLRDRSSGRSAPSHLSSKFRLKSAGRICHM